MRGPQYEISDDFRAVTWREQFGEIPFHNSSPHSQAMPAKMCKLFPKTFLLLNAQGTIKYPSNQFAIFPVGHGQNRIACAI
jgi:hypothetical protein